MNRYYPGRLMPTINFFEGHEENLANNNIKMEKTVKSQPIFAKVNNFSSFSELLKEVADKYEIKIMNEQIKPKSSISYVNIMKELKSKNMEFNLYKSKQKRSFRVFKHIPVIIWMISKKKLMIESTQLLIEL